MQTVLAIIAEPEMLLQQNRLDRVFVASRILGCKISELVPTAAFVQLTVAHGEVSKRIQWCTISIALHGLLLASSAIIYLKFRRQRVCSPVEEYQSNVSYALMDAMYKAFPRLPPRKSSE